MLSRSCRLSEQNEVTNFRIYRIGINSIPACGQNDEVLREHGMDAKALTDRVRVAINEVA